MAIDGETSPLLSGARTPSFTARSDDSLYYGSRDPRANFAWLIPTAIMGSLAHELTNISRLVFFRQYFCQEIGFPEAPDPSLLAYTPSPSTLHCSNPQFPVNIAAMVLTCTFSTISTGWWTGQSDVSGRRYSLTIPMLGSIISNLLFAVLAGSQRVDGLAQVIAFVGLLVEGMLGGSATFRASLNAYVADVAPAGSWSTSFSILQGVFLVCTLLGSSIGLGLDFFKPFLSFAVGAGVAVINLIYIIIFLPESLPEEFELDRPSKLKLGDFRKSVSFLITSLSGHRIALLSIAFFTYSMTSSIESLHLSFALSPDSTATPIPAGYFITISTMTRLTAFFLIIPGIIYLLQRRTPLSLAISTKQYILSAINIDGLALRLLLLADLMTQVFILFIPASHTTLFFLLALFAPLTGGLKPTFQALIATSAELRSSPKRRGTLFGALSVLGMIGETLSHIMFKSTSTLWQTFPKAGFVATATLLTLVGILLWPALIGGRAIADSLPTDRERIRIVVSEDSTGPARDPDSTFFSPVYRRHGTVEGSTEALN
ncbi:hypothetical protein MIND_00249800 [Mycena indigotica]|uniref:Uncharacterized protein n=1 Tax=Mycena indigotica TaxID=2126181 RepID=A0A8H6T5B6_9AGAR|nr:uncharacterized protein MIND_00249800 [Mycena indigotica]KAF7312365.1 hypothetical protein MIND_00249800 [Mycena indigotica]